MEGSTVSESAGLHATFFTRLKLSEVHLSVCCTDARNILVGSVTVFRSSL